MFKKLKLKKIILGFFLVFILFTAYVLLFHTYKGSAPGTLSYHTKDNVKIDDVISNARKLKGVYYDQLQGGFYNVSGKLGFLVCCDIPNLAYAQAGMPLENLLNDDYKAHPEHYDSKNGKNTPSTVFFFRRVENYYAYCKYNGKLIENCKEPKVGDLIFYGQGHVSIISEVHKDGTINEIETNRKTIFVVEHKNKKWNNGTVGRMLNQ